MASRLAATNALLLRIKVTSLLRTFETNFERCDLFERNMGEFTIEHPYNVSDNFINR